MHVTFKLFATLADYLPADSGRAKRHELALEVDDATTPNDLLARFAVPQSEVHLVLVNGIYRAADERDLPLQDGDALAVWPPVAGG